MTAGSKLTALTDIGASVSGDDLVYIVNAPAGTPASRKISLTNLLGTLNVSTPSVINVKDTAYGAVGDGVTDDTAAITAAMSAAVAGSTPKVLHVPAGTYLITSSGALSAFTGTTKEGLVVCGDGMNSSILYLASPGSGERWFFDNNGVKKLANATFRDIGFYGENRSYCSGFNVWSDGHDKDFAFQRCYFKDLSTCFRTWGTATGDHNTFTDCWFWQINSKVLHLYNNPQSVVHGFRDCIMFCFGDCIYAQAGGFVECNGCSIMMYLAGEGYVLHDMSVGGTDIGTGNDGFMFNRCKFEFLHADKKLAYLSSARCTAFDGCNFATDTIAAHNVVSMAAGTRLAFRNCIMPYDWAFTFRTGASDYVYSGTEILFDGCMVNPTLSEQIVHSNASYPYGVVKCINSRSFVGLQGIPYDTMKPLDFYYNHRNSGQQACSAPVLSAPVKQSTLNWPYSLSTQRIITLPRTIAGGGVTLEGIDIYKPAAGLDNSAYALHVGNAAHDEIYGTTGVIAYNEEVDLHVNIHKELSDAARVIHLWCDPTGGASPITGGEVYIRYR